MKKATILFIGLLKAVSVFAGGFETPEDLAEQFTANINAKDQKGQWGLLHPRCVKELSSLQKEFMDASIARDFRKTIPKKRNIRVTKLEEGALSFARSRLAFPVKPTHRYDVEFSRAEGLPLESRTAISRFIAKENGRWFITVPIMDEEHLRKRRDKFSELYVAGYNMSPGPYLGSLENRTDYGKMLARELGIHHVNVRMRYDHPVYIAVHYSEEAEGKTIKSRTITLKKPARIVELYFVHRTKPLEPQTEKAHHWFNVILTSYMKEKDGDRETQREYLQEHPKSDHLAGSRKSINSYLFNGKTPLPINRTVSYYTLIDEKGKEGKDVTYSIDFEVSEKPIHGDEFS
ncbi:MAG: hypothetical protein ACW97O_17235 [Candidatus Thorarchaeota archaeon]|jgi:hypothetical protein